MALFQLLLLLLRAAFNKGRVDASWHRIYARMYMCIWSPPLSTSSGQLPVQRRPWWQLFPAPLGGGVSSSPGERGSGGRRLGVSSVHLTSWAAWKQVANPLGGEAGRKG